MQQLKYCIMKKIMLILASLAIFAGSFAQQQPESGYTREDYLRKSKSQKVLALGLLIGGFGTAIAGAAISDTYASDASTWLIVGGGALVVGSIPLFSSSAKNRRKADELSLAITSQHYFQAGQYGIARNRMPVIMLKFRLQ